MNESDPHFRIGALTEALESAEKMLAELVERPSISREAEEHILLSVRGSLRRSNNRAPALGSAAFQRWLDCVKRVDERVVHHIDGNQNNNDPSNIRLV